LKRTAIRLMVIGLLLLSILAVPFVSACAQQPEPAPAQAPAPAAKVYDWKCTHFLLRGSESWRITSEWIDMINKASGGRLNIEFMGAGEIMPVIETWDAVSRGVIQMNVTCPGYWLGKTPIANFADPIPGSMRDVRDAYAVFHQLGVEELVRKGYGQHNIYLVEITPSYPTTLMTQFPVTKLSDLKGRKLRSMGQAAAVLTEAGASTVYLPAGEIYGALEKGLVEGATWGSINTCVEMGWHEVTKYILMPDLFPVLCSDVQVNMDVWNELPDDLKELLMMVPASTRFTLHRLRHGMPEK